MSFFVSNDDIFSNYCVTDPFGLTYNNVNRNARHSISGPFNQNSNNIGTQQSNVQKNEEKTKQVKSKRSSLDGFMHTFSFLTRRNTTNNNTNKKRNITDNNNNVQNKSKLHTRALSTPTDIYVSSSNNINDNINKIELKKYCTRYSDLLDTQTYQPVLEVEEKPTCYKILVYLPDVQKEEIILEICNNNILIYGERTKKISKAATFKKFSRTFTIPEDTNSDNLKACFKNDILELIFKKI